MRWPVTAFPFLPMILESGVPDRRGLQRMVEASACLRFQKVDQHRVRVDGGPLPPKLFRAETEYRQVKMRRILRSIPRGPDISQHVSAMHRRPFLQALG